MSNAETMIKAETTISYNELCQIAGLSHDIIVEIVEYEIVKPISGTEITHWQFDIESLHWVKRAIRLRQDFQIDWIAVALIVDLLRQRDELQKENAAFQRRLHHFLKHDEVQ